MSKKNSGQYKPGQSGNPTGKGAGRPAIPPEIKAARIVNQFEVDKMINHVAYLSNSQLTDLIKDPDAPALLVGIGRIAHKMMKHGDLWSANFILDRMIGRPGNAPERDITPPEPALVIAPKIKTFEEFCEAAGYFIPFPKQVEMMTFGMGLKIIRLLLGARGYGKTDFVTIMGIAYDLYKASVSGLDMSEHTNLIITKSKSRNSAIIKEIATALKKNGIELDVENTTTIRIKGLIGQDHSVEALTIKTSMRGRHPKRIVMDDPVTDEDVSDAMRMLVKRRYDEAYKLCSNILIIGQPAHFDDLYANLRGVIETMEVPHGSIPELDADLEAMKIAGVDEASIQMSYHLIVPKEGSSIFANLKFIETLPVGDTVAFIDPSDGGDYTAVTIFRGYFDGIAVYGRTFKKAWYHCLDDMAEIFQQKQVKKIAFETNATGEQPIDQLRIAFQDSGIGVVGVHTLTNKHADIVSAGSYSHMIHLSKESDSNYTKQVTKYEYKAKYDDAPDSLARGLKWLGLIKGSK